MESCKACGFGAKADFDQYTIDYYESIGYQTCYSEKYRTPQERMESYVNWPKPELDIKKLVDAGFFYRGVRDLVSCFHCGLNVHEWQPDDDPLIEHLKYNSKCDYLYVKCGTMFLAKTCYDLKGELPLAELSRTEINRYNCKVCKEMEVGCIFYPCEHAVACTNCTVKLSKCPICDRLIRKVLRLALLINLSFNEDDSL
ncbi:baculoviral IAP repeat-containing protein 7-B-like [Panonychus citri]|uniref:baculoviral IAP repeat-containing protein 7-B-like n=1 Tax=Panonychus citri TaxID=50023 RepID=UPI00230717FD|nr:baculoviral IAP repeat-containing protein 7-B-like [Panonychus citri]